MSQPEDLLKQVFAEVLEGGFEDKVAYLSVLLVAVVAEIDEVLDVVVGTNVPDVLTKTRGNNEVSFLQINFIYTTNNCI